MWALVCSLVLFTATAQADCPYRHGIPVPASCGSNPGPMPVPVIGSQMARPGCVAAMTSAIASTYSYDDDDATCHPANSSLSGIGQHKLTFIKSASYAFPPNYKINIANNSNFKAFLYCDVSANTLILAFRGSVSLTRLSGASLDDWIATNLAQQMGDRPLQYGAAEDVAYLIKKDWDHGAFDNVCGAGRPKFLLAGHSKGGGQAQFAAVRNQLEAFVFNSAPVNPLIFSDWVLSPHASKIARRIRAAAACGGSSPAEVKGHTDYFATGRIRDVRMVNDPLTKYLFPICGYAIPHAPLEWLANTLSCSVDGHSIETVVRELHACAP